jgi:aspartyl/asparaginyl beta-hydroxylase (cupin superfamily)
VAWFYDLADLIREKVAQPVYYHVAGGEKRPLFFDIDETMPELREIERNQDVIREELLAVMPRSKDIPEYQEVDKKQEDIATEGEAAWRTVFAEIWFAGREFPTRRDPFPRTGEILDRIPNRISAFFSILEPGKHVTPHNGPAFWHLRYHLGVIVPEENTPTLRLKDQHYTWKQGEGVLFDDSWNHEVENHCARHRVVLCVDVLRPVPWPISLLGRLVRWMRVPPRATWEGLWEHHRPGEHHAAAVSAR